MDMFFPFPLPLTPKQWFYIVGTQCLVAGVIDGGANFGIAYAMYGQQEQVKMWVFSQNTIAGDLGVTPIIQTAVSMIITSTLVHTDLHHSMIKPLAFVWPHVEHLPNPHHLFKKRASPRADVEHKSSDLETSSLEPRSTIGYYWTMLMRFIFEGTENNMLFDRGTKGFPKRLAWTALQGVGLGIVVGFPVWCLFIVILGPIYRMDNMGNRWDPQIIKGVYGFLLGILTNPIIAMLALGSQAEQNLLVQRVAEAAESTGSDEELQDQQSPPPPTSPRVETPRISRLRSQSHASSIGLTANVNEISLGPPLTPTVDRAALPQTPGSVMPRRPRALTGASETGSYYSLGGTGGRAQRGRRPSVASVQQLGVPPTPTLGTRQRTMTESTVSPARPIPPAWMQDVGPASPHRQHTGLSRLMAESKLDVPRESIEIRAERAQVQGDDDGDVFGHATSRDK